MNIIPCPTIQNDHIQDGKDNNTNVPKKIPAESAKISRKGTLSQESGKGQGAGPENEEQLKRVYVEVTNRCNLSCRTCVRNSWNVLPGIMSWDHFQKLLADLRSFPTYPEIFFGGYGEPLSHPQILEMIHLAHAQGAETSLITNGTLLTTQLTQGLVTAGLDFLWVSLDGAHPKSYQDVRLGNHLPQIIDHLKRFQATGKEKPALGIAFVLMKQNMADLPALLALCEELSVDSLFITHVEAYNKTMAKEILYRKEVSWLSDLPSSQEEIYKKTGLNIETLLGAEYSFKITGSLTGGGDPICPFVDRGAAVVRWDATVSPCLPLLYEHTSYTHSWERHSLPYLLGSIQKQTFKELWRDSRYRSLRKRLKERSFSPCATCRDCWLSHDNLQDCMGYEHPTCGGCLWAVGLIQCP